VGKKKRRGQEDTSPSKIKVKPNSSPRAPVRNGTEQKKSRKRERKKRGGKQTTKIISTRKEPGQEGHWILKPEKELSERME